MKTIYIFLTIILFCVISGNTHAQLKVFNDGSVSVGGTTSLPWPFKLQVAGNSVFSFNQNSIVSAAFIRGLNNYSNSTTPDYTWFNDDLTGLFHSQIGMINFTNSGTESMRLTQSHNLLINTTNDDGPQVNVYARNKIGIRSRIYHDEDYGFGILSIVDRELSKGFGLVYNNSDQFFVYGNGEAYSYAWYLLSDSTIKENIKPIRNSLDKVLSLKGYSYNYKSKNNSKRQQIGFLAQEVKEIIPEAVSTTDNGLNAISYSTIIPLLVEAIKEQNIKIEELNSMLGRCCSETKSIKGAKTNENNEEKIDKDKVDISYLFQNIPNPFNFTTKIQYFIVGNKESKSQILIFNMNGELKKSYIINSIGKGSIQIEASELKAGMYYYTLIVNNVEIDTKKMILTN